MKNNINLRFIVLGATLIAFAYFAVLYFSNFNYSQRKLSVENVVEANASPPPIPANNYSVDFRPDGGFEFSSKQSKTFREISWLSMITGSGVGYGSGCSPLPCTSSTPRVEERVNWVPQTPRGLLVTDNERYPWRNENISIENFSFITETKKGQSYKFVGHFSSGGNYEETKPEGAVLVGRLTKLIDGKIVAEEEINFNWFSWDEVDNENYSHKQPKLKK